MAKVVHCRYLGTDCDYTARGDTESEVMEAIGKHAKEAHGIGELTGERLKKMQTAIHDEGGYCPDCRV